MRTVDQEMEEIMDKKSFLRGFGAGVLFATLILGISCLIRTSDASVIKKAKQLGMTYAGQEETLFSSSSPSSRGAVSTGKDAASRSEKEDQESSAPKKQNNRAKETQAPDKTIQKKETDQKEFDTEKKKIKKDFEKSEKELTIRAGEWSAQVSRKLEEMDIIDDAKAFDAYMEKNGYSSRIKAGDYSISQGDDFEKIAKEITSK